MYVPEILQNRSYLLTVIALITTISALGPFFLEELSIKLIAHETLHIAAITFGIFLFILSMMAYNTTKNQTMVFTALAFSELVFSQIKSSKEKQISINFLLLHHHLQHVLND